MKYFVIGGTGSIGSVLVDTLLERGDSVTGLARSSTSVETLRRMGTDVVNGDMLVPDTWLEAASDADVLVQLGSTPTKRSSRKWAEAGGEANRIASRGLVEAQRKGQGEAVLITASGVMVAGDHGDDMIDESVADSPHPLAAYWGPNEEAVTEARLEGMPATALRFGQVYDDNPKSTFGRFFLDAAATGKFRFMGSGENYFPFVHVDDAVDAIIKAAERPTEPMVYIVEDDVQTMRSAATSMMEAFGRTAKSIPIAVGKLAAGKPMAEGFSGSYRVQNSLARTALGWSPHHRSFVESIDEVASRYLSKVG